MNTSESYMLQKISWPQTCVLQVLQPFFRFLTHIFDGCDIFCVPTGESRFIRTLLCLHIFPIPPWDKKIPTTRLKNYFSRYPSPWNHEDLNTTTVKLSQQCQVPEWCRISLLQSLRLRWCRKILRSDHGSLSSILLTSHFESWNIIILQLTSQTGWCSQQGRNFSFAKPTTKERKVFVANSCAEGCNTDYMWSLQLKYLEKRLKPMVS